MFAQSASALREVQATLDRPVPADAEPGSTIDVNWNLKVKRGGELEPFGAGEIFFRLVGRDQSQASEVVVDGSGAFSARVKVPESGIERVEIGIIGIRMAKGHEDVRSDYLIPIVGQSLTEARPESSISASGSSELWIGLVGGIGLVALLAFVTRSRRTPISAAAR